MKYKEIEFKYRADSLSLETFTEFCKEYGDHKKILASGYDYFYQGADKDAFARHRVGPSFNQLTFKKKTVDKNNYIRTEHNVDLGSNMNPDQISDFCKEMFNYEFNTSIFKNVFVYEYARHTFVYYICYDADLKELGRFVEIEMSEHYPFSSENAAWQDLLKLESEAGKVLGISSQARMRKSLFELFKK